MTCIERKLTPLYDQHMCKIFKGNISKFVVHIFDNWGQNLFLKNLKRIIITLFSLNDENQMVENKTTDFQITPNLTTTNTLCYKYAKKYKLV